MPVGKRNKSFEKWKDAKAPVSADKVRTVLDQVFAGRVKIGEGTSHVYKIQVPELKHLPKYQYGLVTLPLTGGQQIKASYLQKLYEAAILLELYPPKQETDEEGASDEEDE